MAHLKYADGMEPTAVLYLPVMVHVKSADDIEPTASDDESSLYDRALFNNAKQFFPRMILLEKLKWDAQQHLRAARTKMD